MAVFEVRLDDSHVQRGNDYLIENPKANLLIITGMNEHSSRYEPFARYLNERGYSVSVLDHWGQGENAESVEKQELWQRGDWERTQMALNLKIQELRKEEKPVYLMGHSCGSFAVQNYLINYPNTADKVVIMGSNGPNNKTLIALGNMMAKMLTTKKNWDKEAKFLASISVGAYAKAVKNRKTDLDWLSFNEENVKRYMDDPYCGHWNSFGFFHEFFQGLNKLYKKKNLQKISKEEHVLIVAGDSDPVGANGKGPRALCDMYKKLGMKDVSCIIYSHMRHEILNEVDAEKPMKDIADFLDR